MFLVVPVFSFSLTFTISLFSCPWLNGWLCRLTNGSINPYSSGPTNSARPTQSKARKEGKHDLFHGSKQGRHVFSKVQGGVGYVVGERRGVENHNLKKWVVGVNMGQHVNVLAVAFNSLIKSRIFESIRGLSLHTADDRSCKHEQFQGPKDHPGSGLWAWNRSKVGLEKTRHVSQIATNRTNIGKQGWIRQTFWYSQGRAPLVSEDVQANAPVWVDVWMVDERSKVDLGWLEWIIGGEMYG